MKTCLLLPLIALSACLENEEELEIRPDGSVLVTLSAQGDVDDLTDGYPVPLGPGWRALSSDAERWLRELGPEMGGELVRARAGELDWGEEDNKAEARLVVERSFASVDELPRFFAPESDPYRTAQLERDTSLGIRDLGARRVFVFERVYRGFDYERFDVSRRLELPEEIEHKLSEQEPLTPAERTQVAEQAGAAYEAVAVEFARDALLGIYTGGDASLAPRAVAGIQEDVRRAARATVNPERIALLLALIERHGGGQQDEESGAEVEQALEQLEVDWRGSIRSALSSGLDANGVPRPARNATLFALEWQFTAFDHWADLGDEKFSLRVTLPGTLVGGNFESSEGSSARWEFEAGELHGRDLVLRAVSVLE
jgi:hypothetical protein